MTPVDEQVAPISRSVTAYMVQFAAHHAGPASTIRFPGMEVAALRGTTRIFGVPYAPGGLAPAIGSSTAHGAMFERDIAVVSQHADSQAIHCNVGEDDRVSVERARECVNGGDLGAPTGHFVHNALELYRDAAMRSYGVLPHFADRGLNALNIVFPPDDTAVLGQGGIGPSFEIGSVIDLQLLGGAFDQLREQLVDIPPLPQKLGRQKHPSLVQAWLDVELGHDEDGNPSSETAAADMVQLAMDAMNASYNMLPHYPQWVTAWPVLEAVLPAGPSRWAELMGQGDTVAPTWLMVLRYTVSDAKILARPTQLDAGDYCWHHPSPSAAPVALGGHPMDLGTISSSLNPEFLHPPIIYRPEFYRAGTLRRLTPVAASAATVLQAARGSHRPLLRQTYPPLWPTWAVPCPVDAPETESQP